MTASTDAIESLIDAARRPRDADRFAAAGRVADIAAALDRPVPWLVADDALRDAPDVALDRGETAAARALLAEARPLAAALDGLAGTCAPADDLAAREARLAGLASGGAPEAGG